MLAKPQSFGKDAYALSLTTPGPCGQNDIGSPDSAGCLLGAMPVYEYFAVFLKKTMPMAELMASFGVSAKELFVAHVFRDRALGGQVFWVKPRIGSQVRLQAFADSRYVVHQCRSDREFRAPFLQSPPVGTNQFLNKSWWPPKPDFKCLVATQNAQNCHASLPNFGEFDWDEGKADAIVIRGSWEKDNIVDVPIPQVKGVPGGQRVGLIRFHRKAALQLQGLWKAWEACGLLAGSRVKNVWGFNPRYQHTKQPHIAISNHSFGTAFDINSEENTQNPPRAARLGEDGCVLDLVEVANEFGFYWGGHFDRGRTDGMHFEVAKLL